MAWASFPYPDPAYVYTPQSLRQAWSSLHAGDAEPWPQDPRLVDAWIAFHAGEFESAARKGLAVGLEGYSVANKAAWVHAVYLEKTEASKLERLLQVAERGQQQQEQQPSNAAGFYWHTVALGSHALATDVGKALLDGIADKVRGSLESTLKLEPTHADAHIAFGVYHAQIVSRVDALAARLTYRADRDEGMMHFQQAFELDPESAIARVEYAHALLLLDGAVKAEYVAELRRQAAAMTARDAKERLDIERAKRELMP